MKLLVKITKWAGKKVRARQSEKWYGTLVGGEEGSWPGFLSFENFKNWPDGYDTYHAEVPNRTSWEEISFEELPEKIKNLKSGDWTLKDHIDWMLDA